MNNKPKEFLAELWSVERKVAELSDGRFTDSFLPVKQSAHVVEEFSYEYSIIFLEQRLQQPDDDKVMPINLPVEIDDQPLDVGESFALEGFPEPISAVFQDSNHDIGDLDSILINQNSPPVEP